ncbi:zinc finger A20 and AN1 domain-containing stress-associated protein 5-like [Momordica charantia]|uniref:Zinc finger A20 and AN1 domain-containing stress-associated protein 5-like n=1 Tax=Momordica charantia TaxID=3673 RepID=A0A6J1DF67_MOMCH|nr:zinc finger A20 and AN1 domain-containing stress-associated protein 5-like [Momordica charantia]
MAQRTEKEETELKVPETITLCVNNCGFTGNPTTNNMCQKCFNATTAAAAAAVATTATTSSSTTGISVPRKLSGEKNSRSRSRSPVLMDSVRDSCRIMSVDRSKSDESAKRQVNRCSGCRKRVGLTGFRCRCGELFCAEHRYSDRHDCSFDYKAAGRDAIARENPVVKAPKIVRV